MAKITHILFDCDNTLVLSEELAFEACADLTNDILEKYGVKDAPKYTGPQLIVDFVGQNFRGMLETICSMYKFTIPEEEMQKYVLEEEDRVIAKLLQKAQPCVGVMPVLEKLYAEKKYGLAVVSSSALRRVKASIKKVGQDGFFPPDDIFSAATSLPEPTSKPNPAVYIHACKVLGKQPGECVAVEDSKSGTLAAVRAGIPVIAYVGPYEGAEKKEQMRKLLTDTGAKVVMNEWNEFYDCMKQIEAL